MSSKSLGLTYIRPQIYYFFENLAVTYFTLTALHSADKFSNERQIFWAYLKVIRPRLPMLLCVFSGAFSSAQNLTQPLILPSCPKKHQKTNIDNLTSLPLDSPADNNVVEINVDEEEDKEEVEAV